MRFQYKSLCIYALLFSLKLLMMAEMPAIHVFDASISNTVRKKEPLVRVLLAKGSQNELLSGVLNVSSGVKFIDALDRQRVLVMDQKKFDFNVHDGQLFINKKRLLLSQLIIEPSDGTFEFNGVRYSGFLFCVQEKGYVYIINCVGLENYVAGVLNAESWPGWPLDAHKVLAIAIRTYVLAMINDAAVSRRLYHVKNTNFHQVYKGIAQSWLILQAVQETNGRVMVDGNNKPILAMYDSCCGGIIPAQVRGIDFKKAPYLARKRPCTFCSACKRYAWVVKFEKAELTRYLKSVFPTIGQLHEIKVHGKDRAGLVTSVAIKERYGVHTVSGKKICSLLKGVKSCCFTIQMRGRTVIFKGRGHGHQMGLCQWGAFQLVQRKRSVEHILKFYYPGIKIVTLAYAMQDE